MSKFLEAIMEGVLTRHDREVADIYIAISKVVYGKEAAQAFGCSPQFINQLKGSGRGPIRQVGELIDSIFENVQPDTRVEADQAIEMLLDYIGRKAGVVWIRPCKRYDHLGGLGEVLSTLSKEFGESIERINEVIHPDSDGSSGVTRSEADRVNKELEELIRSAESAKRWITEQADNYERRR